MAPDISMVIRHNLVHILPYLPVESLLRFAKVDTEWKRTIYSKEMRKKHQLLQKPMIIVGSEDHLDVLNPKKISEVEVLHRPREATDHHLVGTCNGVVCLVNQDAFLLWNPSLLIRVRHIPLPVRGSDLVGFWMNPGENDFLLVSCQFDENLPFRLNGCFVYDSMIRMWNPIAIEPGQNLKLQKFAFKFRPAPAITIDGIGYWVVVQEAEDGSDFAVAGLCFDFKNRSLGSFNLPDGVREDLNYRVSFLVRWGGLGFVHCNWDANEGTLYSREDNNWSLKYTFPLNPQAIYTVYVVEDVIRQQGQELWLLVLKEAEEDGGGQEGFNLQLAHSHDFGNGVFLQSHCDIVFVSEGLIPSLCDVTE